MNRSQAALSRPVPRRFPRVQGRSIAGSLAESPWSRRLALLVVVGLLAWVGLWQLRTPEVNPASAPATEFSAERAMTHLEAIATESRAIGMPGHDAARDYLVAQLAAMGLSPEVQTTTAVQRWEGADSFGTGTVANVVVRIPGTASTGAIALNAHYDSGATGPGASDNGSGVVTVLETLRALLAGEALHNDLIVVFSDAEEEGDLGAAAFNRQHPWAEDVRLALNYEAQGSGGPAILYATSEENGWLTAEFLAAAPDPSAYSLFPEIVRLLAGQRLACDLQDYLDRGSAGLGFVYTADTPAYHTARDSIDQIDPGSVQQEGGYTLAAVRHFGAADLTALPRSSDRVFFNILPGVVVDYAGAWIAGLAALATLLLGVVVGVGFRRRLLTIGGLAVGALAFVGTVVASTALVALLWIAIRSVNGDLQVLLVGSYQTDLYVVALSLTAVALMAAFAALLRRRVRRDDLAAGGLVVWTLLLWPVSLAAPGMSYLILWPLLFALVPLSWSVLGGRRAERPWWQVGTLAVATVPALILLPATAYQIVALLNRLEFFASLGGGPPMLGLWALFVAPLAGLLAPHLAVLDGKAAPGAQGRRWTVPGALALVAVALIAWGTATSGFDAEHPRPNHIAYDLNADTGETRWVSIDRELDEWTREFFPAGAERGDYELVAGFTVDAYLTAAPAAGVAAPEVAVLAVAREGDVRTVRVRLTSPRGAATFETVVTTPGEVVAAAVDGRPLELADYHLARQGEVQFEYVGVPPEGVELTFAVRSAGPIALKVTETGYGLPPVPGLTIRPRPAGMMPASGLPLDATVVRKTFTI